MCHIQAEHNATDKQPNATAKLLITRSLSVAASLWLLIMCKSTTVLVLKTIVPLQLKHIYR